MPLINHSQFAWLSFVAMCSTAFTVGEPADTCSYGDWQKVAVSPLSLPAGTALLFLSATEDEDGVIYGGWAQTGAPTDPDAIHLGVLSRINGELIDSAPLPPDAQMPRVVTGSGGDLYVFWSDGGASPVGVPTISYAIRPSGGEWSGPYNLARDEAGFFWQSGGPAFVSGPDGEIRVVLAALGGLRHIMQASVWPDGRSRIQPIVPARAVPSTGFHLDEASGILAYVAVPDSPADRFTLHITRSDDAGQSWETPKIPAPMAGVAVTEVDLVVAPDGKIHIIVGEANDPHQPWTHSFHHLISADGGGSWTLHQRMAFSDAVEKPRLVADPCGAVHLFFQELPPTRRFMYATWYDGQWTELADLAPGDYVADFDLLLNDDGLNLIYSLPSSPDRPTNVVWKRLPLTQAVQ
jgi:hypothetical protein